MFRFHIQGLSIAVLHDNGLNVLMLNSAHPRKVPNVPYHVQSVFATRDSVSDYTLPRLSSILGRWAPKPVDGEFIGWSLAGLSLKSGVADPVDFPTSTMAGQYHPTVTAGGTMDFSDVHWILDARKMLPTAQLRAGFRTLGADTHAICEFHGGRIEGGQPFADGAAQYTWTVNANYEQAFTDTIDVVFDSAPPEVIATDSDGRPAGRIQFAADGEAWIVNEAPSLAQVRMATASPCGDLLVYLEAFDTETPEEKAAVFFMPAKRFGVLVPSGTSCDALLLDERTS